jgi:hypothetical protein
MVGDDDDDVTMAGYSREPPGTLGVIVESRKDDRGDAVSREDGGRGGTGESCKGG